MALRTFTRRGSLWIVLLAALLFPAIARADVPPDLPGKWTAKTEVFTYTITLFPGGEFQAVMDVGGTAIKEAGRFEATANSITLTSAEKPARKYNLRRTNEGLEVSGGDIGEVPWKLVRTGAAPAGAAPAVANVPQPRAINGLTGMWMSRTEIMSVWLLLQTDGTYWYSTNFGAASIDEVGRYEARDDSIILHAASATPKESVLKYKLVADGLIVSGGDVKIETKLSPVKYDGGPAEQRSVLGHWKMQAEAFTQIVLLLPDGRYLASQFLGNGVHELGQYSVRNGEIVLTPFSGEPAKPAGARRYVIVQTSPRTIYLGGGNIGATPYKYCWLSPPPQSKHDDRHLVGKWVHRDVGGTITIVHEADGSYTAEAIVGGTKVMNEKGRWTTHDGRIRYVPETGKPAERPYIVDGHRFVMVGDGLKDAMEFRSRPPTDPKIIESLAGRWTCKDAPGTVITYDILPTGRFRCRIEVEGVRPLVDEGEITAAGDLLLLDAESGERSERKFARSGDTLSISDPDADDCTMRFTLEAGSAQKVVAEAAEATAKKEKIDATWREKIGLGPQRAFNVPAMGDIPADPKPQSVFQNATVFSNLQSYQREWQNFASQYSVQGGPQPRSTTTWLFRPNGRLYNREVQVTVTPLAGGRGDVHTRTSGTWGRYRIEAPAGGGPEQLLLETDAGEKIAMTIRDGRRTIRWDDTTYANIDAALAELKGR
jgi:hypothetical protein